MKFGLDATKAALVGATAVAALLAAAPHAAADPVPPPAPLPGPVSPEAATLPAPVATAVTIGAPIDPTDALADGVPHLMSPENLPPGTSTTPQTQSRLSYVRDLWHAMQTQEVSGSDALLLLTQRPLNSNPTPGMPAGPQPAPAPVADPAAGLLPPAPVTP